MENRVGVGTVRARDGHEAAMDAARQACAMLEPRAARSLVLWVEAEIQVAQLAARIRDRWPQTRVLIHAFNQSAGKPASGGMSATALALAWEMQVEMAAPLVAEEYGRALVERLHVRKPPSGPRAPLLWLAHTRHADRDSALALGRRVGALRVAGLAMHKGGRYHQFSAGEPVASGLMAAVDFGAQLRVATTTFAGVRLLHAPEPIREIRQGYITRLGDELALSRLTELLKQRRSGAGAWVVLFPRGISVSGHPLDASPTRHRPYLVRKLTGVDPASGGVHCGPGLEVGDRVAFAVFESDLARQEMPLVLSHLRRQLGGGAALLVWLLSAPSHDSQSVAFAKMASAAIRSDFADVPLLQLTGDLRFAPFDDRLEPHPCGLVISVLYAPS